jgi:iron complex outermembrane receptor protein
MRKAWLAWFWLWVGTAVSLGLASTAVAQSRDATYQFELRAQSVGGALRLFGEVTRQQIIFSEATVKGRRSGAVVGRFTAAQALSRLLEGTGLKVTRTEAGVFYIGNGADPDEH